MPVRQRELGLGSASEQRKRIIDLNVILAQVHKPYGQNLDFKTLVTEVQKRIENQSRSLGPFIEIDADGNTIIKGRMEKRTLWHGSHTSGAKINHTPLKGSRRPNKQEAPSQNEDICKK